MATFLDSYQDDDADEEFNEIQYGGKDAVIFLIDVSSPQMHQKREDNDTELQCALRVVYSTLKKKIFASPNDVIGVLLFGTEKNHQIKDFENLSLILPLDVAEGKYINQIEEYAFDLKNLETEIGPLKTNDGTPRKFAIHEALWQCQSLFNDAKGKVGFKKIMLFTSNDDPHANDPGLKRQAEKKSKDLIETGIVLEVMAMSENFDWSKFYGNMITKDLNNESAVAENKYQNKLADLLQMVRKKVHKKRTLAKCFLELGEGVKLGISTYSFVQKANKPSKVLLASDTNEEVRTERRFMDFTTNTPLLSSDINKFIEFGGQKIKFTQDEVRGMAKSVLRDCQGLKLLAFKPINKLDWSYFVRSNHFIYPEESMVKGSKQLFVALMKKCVEKQVAAICAYKYRAITAPSFVALIAQEEDLDQDGNQKTPPGFLVMHLPFHDDIREVPIDFPHVEVNEDQLTAAKALIKKMKLRQFDTSDFENPALQSHYKLVEALALQKEDVEDLSFDNTIPPYDSMKQRLGKLSQEFSDATIPSEELINECQAKKTRERGC